MKLKRLIAVLMFAVYLVGTAGVAFASMSCHCAKMEARAAHLCCNHCEEHASEATNALRAPCCSNNHSTDVALYTATTNDNNQSLKTPCLDLLSACAVTPTAPAKITISCDKTAERRAPFVLGAHRLPSGLRAPPVLV